MPQEKTSGALLLSAVGIFHFISMAFLIICCVTAPVFKQIGLSKDNDGNTYGVFGYCSSSDGCSTASANYSPYNLQNAASSTSWNMTSNAREILGKILIVMPVAAGLNFFAFLLTAISFGIYFITGYANVSSGILFICNLFLSILGFLSAALMCIITFLLFYPHVTWCTWLLIPAAALPLITLVMVFLAYSWIGSSDNGYMHDDNAELLGIVERHGIDDDSLFTGEKSGFKQSVVLPDFQQYTKPDSLIKTDTTATVTTVTDDDLKEDEQEEEEKDNDVQQDVDEANSQPHTAYSAINSEQHPSSYKQSVEKRTTEVPYAISVRSSSSAYNQQMPYPSSNYGDSMLPAGNRAFSGSNIHQLASDNESGLTSVSRRGINPLYNQQQPLYAAQPQQACYYQQQQPQMRQPDASQMILQNNPAFSLGNSMNTRAAPVQRMHEHAQQYHSMMNTNRGLNTGRYKPAYRRMGAARANNMPAPSSLNNPYGFR